MSTNLQSTATYYRGGAGPINGGVGYESGASRPSVARYEFTTPSTGATSVSWRSSYCSLSQYYYNDGSGTQLAWSYVGRLNWLITDNGDAYKYYIGNDGFDVSANQGNYFYGSASINLLPNKTYYLFVFPDSGFSNMYAIFNIGSLAQLTVDGAYGVSSVLATNANIGATSTITINSYSSSFTHTLQYKITGQNSFTNIITKTDQVSYSFTVPVATYNYVSTTEKNVSITIKCITYSGNTSLGESETTITAYCVESECKPTISATYTLLNDASTLTGNNTTAVLNWSNVQVSVSATGNYGATISSYSIIHNGATYNENIHTFNAIQVGTFTYRATDSRGYVSEGTLTLTTIPYFTPTITITTIPPDVSTGATKTKAEGKVFNSSFGSVSNSISVQYRYKVSGGSYGNWITLTHSTNGNNYTTSQDTITLDYRQKYFFQGRIVDSLNTVLSAEISVVALPVFDWSKDDFQFNVVVCFGENSYGATLPQNGKEGQVFFKI